MGGTKHDGDTYTIPIGGYRMCIPSSRTGHDSTFARWSGNFRCPESPGTANGKRWSTYLLPLKSAENHWFPHVATHPTKIPKWHLCPSPRFKQKTSRLQPLTPWNFWVSAHTSPPFPKSPGTTGASFEGSMASCSARVKCDPQIRAGRSWNEQKRSAFSVAWSVFLVAGGRTTPWSPTCCGEALRMAH